MVDEIFVSKSRQENGQEIDKEACFSLGEIRGIPVFQGENGSCTEVRIAEEIKRGHFLRNDYLLITSEGETSKGKIRLEFHSRKGREVYLGLPKGYSFNRKVLEGQASQ